MGAGSVSKGFGYKTDFNKASVISFWQSIFPHAEAVVLLALTRYHSRDCACSLVFCSILSLSTRLMFKLSLVKTGVDAESSIT